MIECENWNLTCCHSGEFFPLADRNFGLDPISNEEWIVEQSHNVLWQTLQTISEKSTSS